MSTRTIHKYPLDLNADENLVAMPTDANLLAVEMQKGKLMLWAAVSTDNYSVKRRILIIHTGDAVNIMARHLGTLLLNDGGYVLHIFDAGEVRQ